MSKYFNVSAVIVLGLLCVWAAGCEADGVAAISDADAEAAADGALDAVGGQSDSAPLLDGREDGYPSSETGGGDEDGGGGMSCEGAAEPCEGRCVDTRTDPVHCGGCGEACEAPPHAETTGCEGGSCQFACLEGWADRNSDLQGAGTDGCEWYDCQPSNRGREICDGKDNDCDQTTDEICPGATTLLGGANTDRINGVAAMGSTVVVGGTTTGPLEGQSVSGNFDGFVARLEPSGAVRWLKVFGADGSERIDDVAVGPDGSVYAIGSGDSAFGGGDFNGGSDVLVAKFDPDGNRQWVAFHGTGDVEFGRSVAVDADGDVIVTAQTRDPYDRESGPEGIVAKFNSAGKLGWSEKVGADATALALDSNAGFYVAGRSAEALDGQTVTGSNDAFVAAYSGSGQREWSRLVGGPKDDRAHGLAVGPSGSLFLTGETRSSFGGYTAKEQDGFVARVDPPTNGGQTGKLGWIGLFGGAGDDIGRDIVVDRGELLVMGTGAQLVGGQSSAGDTDAAVLGYTFSGTQSTARLLGSSAADEGRAVAVGGAGLRVVVGRTAGDLEGQMNSGDVDGFTTRLK